MFTVPIETAGYSTYACINKPVYTFISAFINVISIPGMSICNSFSYLPALYATYFVMYLHYQCNIFYSPFHVHHCAGACSSTLLHCIRHMFGLNLRQVTDYPDGNICWFSSAFTAFRILIYLTRILKTL